MSMDVSGCSVDIVLGLITHCTTSLDISSSQSFGAAREARISPFPSHWIVLVVLCIYWAAIDLAHHIIPFIYILSYLTVGKLIFRD